MTGIAQELGSSLLLGSPAKQQRPTPQQMRGAIDEWTRLLGAERAQFNQSVRDAYAKTTLPSGTTPGGVLRPTDTREVQSLAQIAHRHGILLHTISRGKNWGYGDACAATDGQVIVDLRGMNRIREVNVELGYAVIEPGVSQQQMHLHLKENNLPLLLDVTGAGPDASLVGNILQRGFGHTPYGDRFRNTSGLEVVLPDGRMLNTGFGARGATEVSRVFPWGAGPWIDGLFTQSSLGIVTAVCVWLMPRPEAIEGFALKLSDPQRLGEVVDALRRLRMQSVVRSTVHVANDLRVLSSRGRRPTDGVMPDEPLPDHVRSRLRSEAGIGEWNLLGALYGSHREVRAQRHAVRRELGRIAPVRFFRRSTVNKARRLANLASRFGVGRRFSALVDSVESAFDLLEGIPNAEHLKGAWWKCPANVPQDDLRDCGLIWVSPVIPMTSAHADRLLEVARPIVEGFGFDFLITMTAITERAMCCVISINYDKSDPGEGERARCCAAELKRQTESLGYPGYRNSSVPFEPQRKD